MVSADFLQFVVTMLCFDSVYSFAPVRSPRVSSITFTSCICCIYTPGFGQYWTSFCTGNSSVPSMPCMQFLFVRTRLCLRLPSDSTSRWTPLSLANSSYCRVCSGLSPPSNRACRAHHKQGPEFPAPGPYRFLLFFEYHLRAVCVEDRDDSSVDCICRGLISCY